MLSLPRAFHLTDIYGKAVISPGLFVNALGNIEIINARRLKLNLWPDHPSAVVICGLKQAPHKMLWNNRPVDFQWFDEHKALAVKLHSHGILTWED